MNGLKPNRIAISARRRRSRPRLIAARKSRGQKCASGASDLNAGVSRWRCNSVRLRPAGIAANYVADVAEKKGGTYFTYKFIISEGKRLEPGRILKRIENRCGWVFIYSGNGRRSFQLWHTFFAPGHLIFDQVCELFFRLGGSRALRFRNSSRRGGLPDVDVAKGVKVVWVGIHLNFRKWNVFWKMSRVSWFCEKIIYTRNKYFCKVLFHLVNLKIIFIWSDFHKMLCLQNIQENLTMTEIVWMNSIHFI